MEGEVTPQPLPGLPGVAPPPFLSKTFEMVEDPATDSVVSWSQARNSFVIWDCHKLATALLPKYFKHGNFCSFIRQLNTYGFRKVNPDRWEFANERFLGGQKHLLKDIKRRRNTGQATQQPQSATAGSEPGKESGACVELGQFGFETEVEWLKRDRSVLAAEIVKLKQQQQKSLAQIAALEQRILGTERKQRQTMVFLAKALSNPTFVQQLILRYEQKRQVEGACRKRRLTASPSPDNLQTAADSRMEPEIERLFADSRVEPEIEKLFSSIDSDADSLSRDQLDEGVTMESGDPIIGARSEGIWEELFSEGLIPGGVGPEKGDEEEIHMEMDELADEWGAGPSEWGEEDEKSLAEQMGYLASKLSGFKALG